MTKHKCKCGCNEFLRKWYSVVVAPSDRDETRFVTFSTEAIDEDFESVTCRECGCEVKIKDGKFISYCNCESKEETMKFEYLTMEQAVFLDGVLSRIDRASKFVSEATLEVEDFDAQYPNKDTEASIRRRYEARVGNFDIAIERFLAVYDSICYYRRNNIFPDVMWNHIDPSVKEVISTYKELIESKDFDNLKWFISH